MSEPKDCFYTSHGLRLHYVDWGNENAPPLLLIHGGGDHCRSWDRLARELQPYFHVVAPDLRGHGDSDWTKGGSYALSEYVYDILRLYETLGIERAKIVGHSMGGMVSLIFSGTYPDKVEKLVVLDGVTVLPDAPRAPTHERILKSVAQLGEREGKTPRGYPTIEEAAQRMKKRNTRLSDELALHLAKHALKRDESGAYVWKFDKYQRVAAPHRLWPEDHVALWSRISCPTLLLFADRSFLDNEKRHGLAQHFPDARAKTIADSGHWVQHDQPEEVLAEISGFFGAAPLS